MNKLTIIKNGKRFDYTDPNGVGKRVVINRDKITDRGDITYKHNGFLFLKIGNYKLDEDYIIRFDRINLPSGNFSKEMIQKELDVAFEFVNIANTVKF